MKKNMQLFFQIDLTVLDSSCTVNVEGVRTQIESGSHPRRGGDFHCVFVSQTHCIFADLRELFRETGTGTTFGVFLTPSQVRSFFARKKAKMSDNRNDLAKRRSPCRNNSALCSGAAAGATLFTKQGGAYSSQRGGK